MKKSLLSLAFIALVNLTYGAPGDTTGVSIYFADDPAIWLYNVDGTTALTDGPAGNGNGAVLQLGYYTDGSTAANFGTGVGSWVALTGEGGVNSAFNSGTTRTSIGDSGYTDGQVSLNLSFTEGSLSSGVSLPSSISIPLVLRFYNNTTIASSSHYNEVSANAWTWVAPTGAPGSSMTLTGYDTLEWLGGAGSEFRTSLVNPAAVPEPSTYALLSLGLVGMLALRRKK